jgi:hypothetical protein
MLCNIIDVMKIIFVWYDHEHLVVFHLLLGAPWLETRFDGWCCSLILDVVKITRQLSVVILLIVQGWNAVIAQLISIVMRHVIAHDIFIELTHVDNVWSVSLATSAETRVWFCKHASFRMWCHTECILASRNFITFERGVFLWFQDKSVLEVEMRVAENHDLVCRVVYKLEVVSSFPVVGFLPDANASILTLIYFDNTILLLMVELTVSTENVS